MKFEYFFGLIDQNKKKLQVKTNLSFFLILEFEEIISESPCHCQKI